MFDHPAVKKISFPSERSLSLRLCPINNQVGQFYVSVIAKWGARENEIKVVSKQSGVRLMALLDFNLLSSWT